MQQGTLLEKMYSNHLIKPTGSREGEFMKAVFLPFQTSGIYTPSVGKPIYFQPDSVLQSDKVIITGIDFVTATTNTNMLTSSGDRLTITDGMATQGFFVLSNNARAEIYQTPLTCLILRLNGGRPTFTYFDDFRWQDCYCYFYNVTDITVAKGLWFNIFYTNK
jgi:hypothetical protein